MTAMRIYPIVPDPTTVTIPAHLDAEMEMACQTLPDLAAHIAGWIKETAADWARCESSDPKAVAYVELATYIHDHIYEDMRAYERDELRRNIIAAHAKPV